MKNLLYISFIFLLQSYTLIAQIEPFKSDNKKSLERELTIEPAIGIHTNFGTDLLITNLVQWSINKRVSVAAHSSYNINNITQRDFNYIKTEYNYSLNQKFGIGRTFYAKRSSHSFFIMAGAKYTAFKETLDNPDFDKVSSSVNALSPDYGMMYSLKRGTNNRFFTFRMYIPLYPWPTKGTNILYMDNNFDNIALEVGLGIRIK